LFINNISQSLAECLSYLVANVIFTFIGIRWSFIYSYTLGLIGMSSLLAYKGDEQVWLSLFIILGKFGLAAGFNICYIANQEIFPIEAVVWCFGMCAAIGHIAAIFAPQVAELEPNSIAKWAFIGCSSVALFAMFFLRPQKRKVKYESDY
jgi:hypothetical protein